MVYLAAIYFFIVSMTSAYFSIKVRNGELPMWITLLSSVFIGVGWMTAVKSTKIPLVNIGSIVDVMACMGFYIGLLILGDPIKIHQYYGMVLILLGLYIVNK
jgi:drug/metabolite transporter (DMT)-like permease